MFKDKFKKFDGSEIPDIIEYIHEYIKKDPTVTITVGCDSMQVRRKTIYAITIMMYNIDIKNGAHVVFFKEIHKKIRNKQQKLFNEAKYVYDLGMYLDKELASFYTRKDLTDDARKKYKYHLLKCDGNFLNVENHKEASVIKNLNLVPADFANFRLVDIHVDFNPKTGSMNPDGAIKNKSYTAYKSFVPWLKGTGFRTWSKPVAYASTSAADLLLKKTDKKHI